MGFLCWGDIRHAAISSVTFPLGLSFFYLALCVMTWVCGTQFSLYISVIAPDFTTTNANFLHIMAIGTGLEFFSIIFCTLAIAGITKRKMCLLVSWIIYQPLYILYQIAVIVMMIKAIVYLANDYNSGTPSSPAQFYNGNYPVYQYFIPVIIFWGIQILINIVGEAIAIVCLRSFSDITDDAFKHH